MRCGQAGDAMWCGAPSARAHLLVEREVPAVSTSQLRFDNLDHACDLVIGPFFGPLARSSLPNVASLHAAAGDGPHRFVVSEVHVVELDRQAAGAGRGQRSGFSFGESRGGGWWRGVRTRQTSPHPGQRGARSARTHLLVEGREVPPDCSPCPCGLQDIGRVLGFLWVFPRRMSECTVSQTMNGNVRWNHFMMAI